MDAHFANYRQPNTYIETGYQSYDGTFSGTYDYHTPQTPAFSPGSSSTTRSSPVVPTPPPLLSEIPSGSDYQFGAQSAYGGWDGCISSSGENVPFFQSHIDANIDTDVHLDLSHSEGCSGVILPPQRCQPPGPAPPPAAPHPYDHFAYYALGAANHRPVSSTPYRPPPPSTIYPDRTDQFLTHWDSLGNLMRTPVPTTCGYADCAFVGLPDALWIHICDAHHTGANARTQVLCGWEGCGPTHTKPMTRRSLQRHIMDIHLSCLKLHCPYCHFTSRENEYVVRHGENPAVCSERAAWEAHVGDGWAWRDHCEWCVAITPLV